ncbi:MAG TPA: hypothetical protein VHD60_04300 [Candidatus Saccharimonadales bacterium]|nr:hypothetical protein [Candidatus Saccharimonadales bacterium]
MGESILSEKAPEDTSEIVPAQAERKIVPLPKGALRPNDVLIPFGKAFEPQVGDPYQATPDDLLVD